MEDLDGELFLGAGVGAGGGGRVVGVRSSRWGVGGGRSRTGSEVLRELVDGVVEVTGVRFIWEMSKSSQSSVSWAVPTRLK